MKTLHAQPVPVRLLSSALSIIFDGINLTVMVSHKLIVLFLHAVSSFSYHQYRVKEVDEHKISSPLLTTANKQNSMQ